MYFSSILS